MAKLSQVVKSRRKPKWRTRMVRRCAECGRGRGFMRDFGVCRICFREHAESGEIPGIRKSSW